MAERITRRELLGLGWETIKWGGIMTALTSCGSELPSLEYGFNTHLSADPSKYENLTLEVFKEDIDKMKELGMSGVRFNVKEWELAESHLEKYDEAIKYANQAGLKVFLVTNVPGLSKGGENLEADLDVTKAYYERLVNRWKGQVFVWQVFNEPDDHTYAKYRRIENKDVYPSGYLEDLSKIVARASGTIKEIDPDAKVTVNVSLWQGSDPGIQYEEIALFDAVHESLDYITLDIYPDTNEEAIKTLQDQVAFFHYRYDLPVVIGEVGLPTGDGRFTEADQGEFVAKAIDSLQAGRVRPEAILLYEYRDESMKAGAEASFGFTNAEGTPKPGFDQVMEAIDED